MVNHRPITKAIIPAAGLGSRFLPVTKAVPKEMLPILDKPMLQFVIEEVIEAGIEEIILVVSPGKESISSYFRDNTELEKHLSSTDGHKLIELVKNIPTGDQVSYVVQKEPLGLGHAVLTAHAAIGDNPFAIVLPDDIITNTPGALRQMIDIYNAHGSGVIAVEAVPWESVNKYGVISGNRISDNLHQIESLVEKPPLDQAPSNLCIVGRYILPHTIFNNLRNTKTGAKNEIQLTDALSLALNTERILAYEFEGVRYDGGTPFGLLRASLECGLARNDMKQDIIQLLESLLAASSNSEN